MSVNSKMTAIADAIRNLLDISGPMGLDAMARNISSIAKRGAVAGMISTKSEQYIIPAGYHNGNGTVGIADAEQAKIIAENIKNGVTILGVSGTASGDIYAIIAVTYPAGSTCTCSDGTITLTARDTSGEALFNVTVGEWTVSCTNGTDTASKSVTITADGKFESVELSYNLYLYKNGDENIDLTGGWIFYGTAAGTIKNNGSNIAVDITGISGATSYAAYRTANKIDLSTLKTLNIKVDEYLANEQWFYLCVSTEYQTSVNFFADGYAARVKLNADGVFSIDVSNLYDSYYIWLSCNHNGPASIYYTKSKISEIWGERGDNI